MLNTSTSTPSVKKTTHLQWIGDNIGGSALLVIEAVDNGKTVYFSLEEALNRIEEFAEKGRDRILSALGCHFGRMPA